MPLSAEIQAISQAHYELAESNRKARLDLRYRAGDFVKNADATECLWLINKLIDRVSSITGMAPELEDADCKLTQFIDNEEPGYCSQCNGSGEGQHDGTRCRSCKGTGTESREE